MKTFNIMLLSTLGNLLLVFGVLVAINVPDLSRLSQTNWLTFTPLAVLYALLVALLGLGLGSLVNGLLVYPKKPWRNLRMSEVNAGIVFLLLVLYFAWATGSFSGTPPKAKSQSWMHTDLLYKDISERGFKAF
ncbi:MAG TPA: hypothetical protein VL547_14540 [Dinghuibacter sp.]|jgi:hypothetical protein|uniref:hypothetical protein n=1 Tax=Dinghuibacter sp. TaxID=2024697 RepID=UPI002CF4D481|nr:hypothetical protein [Dinghuibacter sp.]HTJ13250.1 hypothetical protein [Dinghuibacter sp.]